MSDMVRIAAKDNITWEVAMSYGRPLSACSSHFSASRCFSWGFSLLGENIFSSTSSLEHRIDDYPGFGVIHPDLLAAWQEPVDDRTYDLQPKAKG